jgi:hypothetical protein
MIGAGAEDLPLGRGHRQPVVGGDPNRPPHRRLRAAPLATRLQELSGGERACLRLDRPEFVLRSDELVERADLFLVEAREVLGLLDGDTALLGHVLARIPLDLSLVDRLLLGDVVGDDRVNELRVPGFH